MWLWKSKKEGAPKEEVSPDSPDSLAKVIAGGFKDRAQETLRVGEMTIDTMRCVHTVAQNLNILTGKVIDINNRLVKVETLLTRLCTVLEAEGVILKESKNEQEGNT